MIVTTVVVYLIVMACPVYAMEIDRKYKRVTIETSTGTNALLSVVPKRSKIECVMTCSEHNRCNSFSFDRKTKACSMALGYTNLPPGNVYYDEKGCSEKFGYTYLKRFILCFRIEGNIAISLEESKAICESQGAHLMTIKNRDVGQYLISEIYGRGLDTDTLFFFIDGSDEETEDIWKTSTGDVMIYSDWHQTEPQGGVRQNCLAMSRRHNYQWADVDCEGARRTGGYICQIDIA